MSGLKLPLTRELLDQLRGDPDYLRSIREENLQTGLSLQWNDAGAGVVAEYDPMGGNVLTVVLPLDDNQNPRDGRLYLKDRFFFDSQKDVFLRAKRSWELVSPDDVDQVWQQRLEQYQRLAEPSPDVWRPFAEHLLLGHAHPLLNNPKFFTTYRENAVLREYLDQIVSDARKVAPKIQIKVLLPETHFAARKESGRWEVRFRWVLDTDWEPGNGRLIAEDQLELDPQSGALKGHRRKWFIPPPEEGGPRSPGESDLAQVKALQEIPAPNSKTMTDFWRAVQPALSGPLRHEGYWESRGSLLNRPDFYESLGRSERRFLLQMARPTAAVEEELNFLLAKDPESTFEVRHFGKHYEYHLSFVIANRKDSRKNRIYCHDRFILGEDQKKLLEHTRFYEADASSFDDPELLTRIPQLNNKSGPSLKAAERFIQRVAPSLHPGRLSEAQEILAKQIPPSPEGPNSSGEEGGDQEQKLLQSSLKFAHSLALEIFLSGLHGSKFSSAQIQAALQQLFEEAQTQMGRIPHQNVWQLLRSIPDGRLDAPARQLRGQLGRHAAFLELVDLLSETDTALRGSDLYRFAEAGIMGGGKYPGTALLITHSLESEGMASSKTRDLQNLLEGKGGLSSLKVEMLGHRFVDQVLDEKMIVAMMGAGFVGSAFEYGGLLALGRWGCAGRLGAAFMGTGGEALAFTTLHNTARSFSEDPGQVWSHFGAETLSGIMLFSMFRFTHAGTGWLTGRLSRGAFQSRFLEPGLRETEAIFSKNLLGGIHPRSHLPLNAMGRRLINSLNFLGGVESFYLSGKLSSWLGLHPQVDQGFFEGQILALANFIPAMIGFRVADAVTGGRLNVSLSRLKGSLYEYRASLQNKKPSESREDIRSVPEPEELRPEEPVISEVEKSGKEMDSVSESPDIGIPDPATGEKTEGGEGSAETLRQLQESLRLQETHVKQLEGKLREQKAAAEGEVQKVRLELDEARDQLKRALRERQEIQSKLTLQQELVKTQEGELEGARNQIAGMEVDMERYRREVSGLETKLNSLDQYFDQAQKELKDLREELARAESSQKVFQEKHEAQLAANQELREANAELKGANSLLNQQVRDLESQWIPLHQEVLQLREIAGEMEGMENELSIKGDRIATLESQITSLEAELNSKTDSVAEAWNQLEARASEIEVLQDRAGKERQAANEAKREAAGFKAKMEAGERDLENAQARSRELAEALEAQKKRAEQLSLSLVDMETRLSLSADSKGDEKGDSQNIFLPRGPALTLGRHPASDIVIPERIVSRHHLQLRWYRDHWTLRDLNSSQGTSLQTLGETGGAFAPVNKDWVGIPEGAWIVLGRPEANVKLRIASEPEGDRLIFMRDWVPSHPQEVQQASNDFAAALNRLDFFTQKKLMNLWVEARKNLEIELEPVAELFDLNALIELPFDQVQGLLSRGGRILEAGRTGEQGAFFQMALEHWRILEPALLKWQRGHQKNWEPVSPHAIMEIYRRYEAHWPQLPGFRGDVHPGYFAELFHNLKAERPQLEQEFNPDTLLKQSPGERKKLYRRLSKELHPDHKPRKEHPFYADAFKALNGLWEIFESVPAWEKPVTPASDSGSAAVESGWPALVPGQRYQGGRTAGSEYFSGHPTISRRHFEVFWESGSWRVEVHSPNGLRINGTVHGQGSRIELQEGDWLFAGPNALVRQVLVDSEGQVRLAGPLAYSFPSGHAVSLGRHPQNSIYLPENSISANHLRFQFQNGAWVLQDLGSSNGTFLNGQAIHRPGGTGVWSLIPYGSALKVGRLMFRVYPERDGSLNLIQDLPYQWAAHGAPGMRPNFSPQGNPPTLVPGNAKRIYLTAGRSAVGSFRSGGQDGIYELSVERNGPDQILGEISYDPYGWYLINYVEQSKTSVKSPSGASQRVSGNGRCYLEPGSQVQVSGKVFLFNP